METDRMLLDKSNKADIFVKDVEKKFASSVKMANEFRNVIEIKEDQVKYKIYKVATTFRSGTYWKSIFVTSS